MPESTIAGNMNDQREMERLRQSYIAALGTLIKWYRTKALRAAFPVTRDLAQAVDVVSSAFLRVFERADQFGPRLSSGPWSCRIVVNDAIRRLQRKEVRRKCVFHVR